MLLKSTFRLFVVHPSRSLVDFDDDSSRVTATVHRADFDRSILEQIDDDYDLLVLDWSLEAPDARGVLDAFRQRAPETKILVLADDVPADDPVDRGADDLLVTPVPDERLYATVERLLLQKDYVEAINEFFRLSSERALLESERRSGLDVSDRYRKLARQLDDQRERAATVRDALSNEEFDRSLRRLLDD